MSLLVDEVDLGSLVFLLPVVNLVVSFEAPLAVLVQPQPHLADCASMYSMGAASKKSGMLETVQYFRNPTSLVLISLDSIKECLYYQ